MTCSIEAAETCLPFPPRSCSQRDPGAGFLWPRSEVAPKFAMEPDSNPLLIAEGEQPVQGRIRNAGPPRLRDGIRHAPPHRPGRRLRAAEKSRAKRKHAEKNILDGFIVFSQASTVF